MLLRGFSFRFLSAIYGNHPSGISPSKKGNKTFPVKGSACKGNVRLTGSGLLLLR